jgi:hypothetical protein
VNNGPMGKNSPNLVTLAGSIKSCFGLVAKNLQNRLILSKNLQNRLILSKNLQNRLILSKNLQNRLILS